MLTLEQPPSEVRLKRTKQPPLMRMGISLALWLLLCSATLWNEQAYHFLGMCWQKSIVALGIDQQVPSLFQSGSTVSQVMRRPHSIPAVLSYSILYIGICLLLLFSFLHVPIQRRLVVSFYGLASIASIFLLIGSRMSGITSLATLNSDLVHFVVSPVPVIMLIPLLRWYVSQAPLRVQ